MITSDLNRISSPFIPLLFFAILKNRNSKNKEKSRFALPLNKGASIRKQGYFFAFFTPSGGRKNAQQ